MVLGWVIWFCLAGAHFDVLLLFCFLLGGGLGGVLKGTVLYITVILLLDCIGQECSWVFHFCTEL